MAKEREFGLDAARAAAVTLVLTVHVFQNIGFYNINLQGPGMALAAMGRMACMTCVPLFLLLTGYLCVKRTWSPGYYRKLIPILLTYVLAGIACMAYQVIWLGTEIGPLGAAARLLGFYAAPYAWYVEMYVGLFLISPFLNAAWRGLGDREKLALVVTALAVIFLPPLTNIPGQILPDWWTDLYPLGYYILGAWLREHPIRANGWLLLAGWLGIGALSGALVFLFQHGQPLTYAPWNYYQSLLVAGESVCLFSLLVRCGGERLVKWCVRRLAKLALPIYLLSYITDQLIYPRLIALAPTMTARFLLAPLAVIAGLAGAGVMAQFVDWIVTALTGLIPKPKQTAGK